MKTKPAFVLKPGMALQDTLRHIANYVELTTKPYSVFYGKYQKIIPMIEQALLDAKDHYEQEDI